MTELIIKIPPEKEALLKELIIGLGGSVSGKKKLIKSGAKTKKKTKKDKKVSPTFLFGKWKNFDIDARKLRDESWTREF